MSRRSVGGRPRWLTVLMVAGILIVLLVAVLHLTGGGPRHDLPDHGSAGASR